MSKCGDNVIRLFLAVYKYISNLTDNSVHFCTLMCSSIHTCTDIHITPYLYDIKFFLLAVLLTNRLERCY